MQIKMLKVSASALLCADAGEVVTVDDVLGRQLIVAGAAKSHTPVRRETAMIDPSSIEEAERERSRALAEAEAVRKAPNAIKHALDQLKADADDDWTAGGKPAMDRIKDLTGSASLTRAEVDAAFPDFARPGEEPAQVKQVVPVPATKAGPRSSAP